MKAIRSCQVCSSVGLDLPLFAGCSLGGFSLVLKRSKQCKASFAVWIKEQCIVSFLCFFCFFSAFLLFFFSAFLSCCFSLYISLFVCAFFCLYMQICALFIGSNYASARDMAGLPQRPNCGCFTFFSVLFYLFVYFFAFLLSVNVFRKVNILSPIFSILKAFSASQAEKNVADLAQTH